MPSAADFVVICEGLRLMSGYPRPVRTRMPAPQTETMSNRADAELTLQRYFNAFCNNNPHHLTDEKFKKEGDFPDGKGKKVAIWAFKAWQWRVYGAILVVGGHRTFVGVRVDPSKKKDKANKALLKAAAIDIGQLSEYRPTQE